MKHKLIHLNKYYPLDTDPILEVFLPITSYEVNPPKKSILICPGGGYGHLSPREADPVATTFISNNFNAFVLHYTVNKAHPVPILELMAAMDYLKSHQKSLYIKKDNIALIGFSAGGHLAGSFSYMHKDQGLREKLNIKRDLSPDALILSYPVISLGVYTHKGTKTVITNLDEELVELLSIHKHVTKDYPPTFIWATKEDNSVPYENTLMMVEALKKAHVKHQCVIYPTLWHGLSIATDMVNDIPPALEKDFALVHTWINKSLKFVNKIFDK